MNSLWKPSVVVAALALTSSTADAYQYMSLAGQTCWQDATCQMCGYEWNGSQCVAVGTADPYSAGGGGVASVPDCPGGESWNGFYCSATSSSVTPPAPPAAPPGLANTYRAASSYAGSIGDSIAAVEPIGTIEGEFAIISYLTLWGNFSLVSDQYGNTYQNAVSVEVVCYDTTDPDGTSGTLPLLPNQPIASGQPAPYISQEQLNVQLGSDILLVTVPPPGTYVKCVVDAQNLDGTTMQGSFTLGG